MGVLPVVDGEAVIGVITDRDIVVRGLAEGAIGSSVADIMHGGLVCLSPDDDEREVVERMADYNVRRLPVVENGRLVGMVSVGDLAVRTNERHAGEVMGETGPAA